MADLIPQKTVPLRKKRYLLRDSDRSGFTYRNVELVLDEGNLVGGDEFDAPPPSKKLFPAEGEVSPGDTRSDYTSYSNPVATQPVVQTIGATDQIKLDKQTDNANQYTYIQSIAYVDGVTDGVAITSNPQVVASNHGDFLVVQGAGTSFVLRTGYGLRLYTDIISMTSGRQLNLIYDATNSLWTETSRGYSDFRLNGEF